MRTFIVAAIGAAALVAPAALADAHSEIADAAAHAGYAAGAADLAGVHHHLHHALNCIVGPAGEGFDAKEMNPCANSGNGAMADSESQAQKTALQNAIDMLNAGIGSQDIKSAKADASKAEALLKAAE